jgi:pimeloyl-ACP methyl ester carboxylesterase
MKSFKLVGTGPRKVMLFPGLLGTRDAFDEMLRWADLTAFQYAVVEYRGYGQARNEPGLKTLREVVIDATRLADYLGWTRFAVAGHSLGALAAQMIAVALPQRVDAIVSIAGMSARGGSRDPERTRLLREAAELPNAARTLSWQAPAVATPVPSRRPSWTTAGNRLIRQPLRPMRSMPATLT